MRFGFVAVLCMLVPSVAAASDFMDTRITFGFSDDNIFQGPTTTNPSSPSIPNFTPSQSNTQFYDNYETRYTGFETLSHLSIYKKMPSFFAGVDTEAALVIRALVLGDSTILLGDDGSYLRLAIPLGDNKEVNQLSLVAYPVSSDRFRLGYSYALSWGGNPIFGGTGLVPGIKLNLIKPNWYAYLGAKATLRQINESDGTKEQDTVFGLLGGAGVDLAPTLTAEVNGGVFNRGTLDVQQTNVASQALYGYGGSVQLAYHKGLPIGSSIDLLLYRNDPDMPTRFFLPETYDDQVSIVLKSEFTVMGQNLQNVAAPTTTKSQVATAGDINFALKYKKWRMTVDLVYRSLSFILFNVPSNPPYVDFPPGTQNAPEFFGAVGADYFIARAHLTPGLKIGLQRPAYYKGASAPQNNPDPTLQGVQTFVFRDSVNVDILDPNYSVQPILAMTASLKWDLSEIMSAGLSVLARYDTNKTTYKQDPDGINVRRTFLPPWSLGFNLIMQARF